jgi:hypothetical protein
MNYSYANLLMELLITYLSSLTTMPWHLTDSEACGLESPALHSLLLGLKTNFSP